MWNTLTDLVNSLGYLGIFTATSLEYGCFPVSSEVLLPFIGYFVNQGGLSLFGAIAVSTLGGVVGSLFCYLLGRFGKHFIEKKLCVKFKSVKKGIDKAKELVEEYTGLAIASLDLFENNGELIELGKGATSLLATEVNGRSFTGTFLGVFSENGDIGVTNVTVNYK